MRVFVLTLGTRGDFELFLTLGRALARDGHEVLLGTSPCFAERARLAGVEVAPLGSGQQHEMVSILRSLAELPDPVQRTRAYAERWLRPQLAEARGDIAAHAGHADYFVSNLKMAMRRGDAVIPGASVSYDPPRTLDAFSSPRNTAPAAPCSHWPTNWACTAPSTRAPHPGSSACWP